MDLYTKRLKLIEISMVDLQEIHAFESIPEVDRFNTLGIPNDIEDSRKIILPVIADQRNDERKLYCWKVLDQDAFIGLAGLSRNLDRFKIGEIYYKLKPSSWGQGYATEIARRLVRFGFEGLGLHRVEAGVATENIASIRVLEKIGMKREGCHRKILPIRGEWKDNFHYALVEDDPWQ